MDHDEGEGGRELDAEVPVGHAVEGVAAGAVESEGLRSHFPVDVVGGAGEGAGAEGRYIHPFSRVLQAADVPQEHLGVRQQVVAEDDGLCPLQVGVGGHDVLRMLRGLLREDGDELLQLGNERVTLVTDGETVVEGHLVVPGAGRVEAFARRTDALGQGLLHEGVDVLGIRVDLESAGLDVIEDALQTCKDGLGVLLRVDALCAQHGSMGHGPGDVLFVHPGVELDARVEVVGFRVDLFREPSGPEFHGW